MRGIVTIALNERRQPSVNAQISRYYSIGDIVDITGAVPGDVYDSDDLWYKLSNGTYVWSGGVSVVRDCSVLPLEDRDHYLISYRPLKADGRPDLDTRQVPDNLYFAPLRLPAEAESVRVNNLLPAVFANTVAQSVSKLPSQRKHVFIYIHGYQLLSSLKLDLLSNFVLNYFTHPDNQIAKVAFMAWPGQGGPGRKTVDDRSIRAGQRFTANNLFSYFKALSDALKAEGRSLNLIVHSFGHQLLNGMLNPEEQYEKQIPSGIFEHVFLMAPDVTHLTLKQGGSTLRNYYKDKEGADFHYEYRRLKQLAKQVHIFYDKYDYLLYSSTKKFVAKGELNKAHSMAERLAITGSYRNLGNHGINSLAPDLIEDGFNLVDVGELFKNGGKADLFDYPYRTIRQNAAKKIDAVWEEADYDGINAGNIVFNARRFPDYHRYLFTCKAVVDEIQRLLK